MIFGEAVVLPQAQTVTVTGAVSLVRESGGGKLDNSNAVIWLKPAGAPE